MRVSATCRTDLQDHPWTSSPTQTGRQVWGAPLLPNALAHFECRNEKRYDGGDHLIIIGAVERLSHRDGEPLLFNAGRYAAVTNISGEGDVEIASQEFADLLL